ncbi:MAG: response regulator [Acidobacteria bacterium]|nr:response regulator [Acidobacteriota bacterium]
MGPKRIMIIDNSEIQCRALTRAFMKLNAATLTAAKGEEGLELAAMSNPDLIVLDLLLSDMDGFEVCELLKKNEQTRHIPVVMFTGRTRIVDIMRGFEAGADMFIGKGLGYDKLVDYISAVLVHRNGTGDGVEYPRVMRTCKELLDSLWAAFDGVVCSRLEISLGTNAAAAVLQQAAEKSPAGWKIQWLREGTYDYLAVREAVVAFNAFVAEVFNTLEAMAGSIEVSHLRDAFEQQLPLFD